MSTKLRTKLKTKLSVHVTFAKKDSSFHVLVTLVNWKDTITSSFLVIASRSAAIGTETLLRGKSVHDSQTGVYCESLKFLPFPVNGSKAILTFDVEKRKRHERNSSARQLLQLLQLFGDLSVVNSSNLLEIAVFRSLKNCIHQALYEILLEKRFAQLLSSAVILSFLFGYLMGYIQRGGWATYSDTSWEFRATYVSIELRLAAYFWFKFRALPVQPSSPHTGLKRSRAELKGRSSVSECRKTNKFYPRVKAYLGTGDKEMTEVKGLRTYNTRQEAEDVYWIVAYYYNRRDRFKEEFLSWCDANLLALRPNLSDALKIEEVLKQAKNETYLTYRRHQDQGGVFVEPHLQVTLQQHQAAGYSEHLEISGTEGESLTSIGDLSLSSAPPCIDFNFWRDDVYQTDFPGTVLGQHEYGVLTIDDYFGPSGEGDVFVQRLEFDSQNLLTTGRDEIACNVQEDFPHLQPSHGGAIVLVGGGSAGEAGMRIQDETQRYSVQRASTNHTQAGDLPMVAQKIEKLKLTATTRSTLRKLHEQGWNFQIEPRISTEFSIAFPEGLQLTGPHIFAFEEIHEQGFEIILEATGKLNALHEDDNGRPQRRQRTTTTPVSLEASMSRPQSGSGSLDLCRSCNAPLYT